MSSTNSLLQEKKDTLPLLLQVNNLAVRFPVSNRNFLSRERKFVHAVRAVSLKVEKGKTLGIVGESGSGKTSLGQAIIRLVPAYAGEILLDGVDLLKLNAEAMRLKRRDLQIIFQDPYASLNPRQRAGEVVAQPRRLLGLGKDSKNLQSIEDIFSLVGLRTDQMALFPHQFSGGQRQRIAIARSISTQPKLIVCDEPVSALDVAIQAQILNLLQELQEALKISYIFISHDLAVVRHICDEVLVMYLGNIVEQAPRRDLFTSPKHPYTQSLLMASPSLARRKNQLKEKRFTLKGDPPSPIDIPKGCAFAGRCRYAKSDCLEKAPELNAAKGNKNHKVACYYPL